MKYEVWTKRALLVWVPICLMLGLGPAVASLLLALRGADVPGHIHILNVLVMPLVVALIVWRRHDLHVRIRDSIDAYASAGTRLVFDVPYVSAEEIAAIDVGLARACVQVPSAAGFSKGAFAALDMGKAFLIVKSEVYAHRGGKRVRVGGLTYAGGPMLVEYTTDLALLTDRVRHEACHWLLNAMNRPDWTGDDHHRQYPELFA